MSVDMNTLPSDVLEEIRQQIRREIQSGRRAAPDGRTVTETMVDALAHCGRISEGVPCRGYEQESVKAIETLEEHTIGGRGGMGAGDAVSAHVMKVVENSWTRLRFADPDEVECPHCGSVRELSRQVRPKLETSIGGQDALLRMRRAGMTFDPTRQEAITSGARETPFELLQRRYVAGEIEDDEYARKLVVIEGPSGATEPDGEMPAGIRRKGQKFQASWRDADGQHGPTFDTLDEAVAAREAGIAERDA